MQDEGIMQEIIIAIVIGIFLGWFNLLSYKVKLWLSRISTACLFIMLICLGAKIGCDSNLLSQIKLLGIQSVILGSCTIIGSLLALYPLAVMFRKRNAGEDESHGV